MQDAIEFEHACAQATALVGILKQIIGAGLLLQCLLLR
jgi:hypothetical protein